MALSYNLGYQESISVHPTRRQIFAGKPYSTFPNSSNRLICRYMCVYVYCVHIRVLYKESRPGRCGAGNVIIWGGGGTGGRPGHTEWLSSGLGDVANAKHVQLRHKKFFEIFSALQLSSLLSSLGGVIFTQSIYKILHKSNLLTLSYRYPLLPKSSTPLMLAEKVKGSTVLSSLSYISYFFNISVIFHLWSSSHSLCVAQAAVGGRARKPFYCKSSREAASEIQLVFLHKFCKKII